MDQNHDRSSASKPKPSLGSMAKMLDLENAYSSVDSNFGSDRSAALSSFENDEIGSEDAYSAPPALQDDPYESRTKQPLWANPFAKAGLVGTGTLVAVIATSTLLGDITKGTNVQAEAEKKEVVSTAEVPASKEEDKGKLLAEIALGTQGRALEELNKNNQPAPTTKPTPNPKTPPVIIRTSRPANRPVSRKDLAALAAILRQRSQPAPVQAAAFNQNLDPQQQWQMLSQVGSYGQISSGRSNGGENFSNSNGQNAQLVSQVQSNSIPEEESPLLTGRVRRSVVTGSTAQGLLSTPVVWEGGRRGAQGDADNAGAVDDEDRFIIQLTSALKASDGSEALAVGTPLVVKVRSVSGSGTLKLSAVAVIMDGQETQIPPGSISIRAASGGPLTARNMQDRGGEIASSDAGIFALAGISKAASLFTRAQSTTTSNGFNSVTSTQNPAPDILAGVLEGGTSAIINQIQARNERAIQESLARPDLWMLAAGTSVQVFVNKSVPNL
jgi:Bacterial conjugation TrbI-like protein